MNHFERAVLIVNPVAGRGRSQRVSQRICKELVSRGVACTLKITAGGGDASTWSRAAGDDDFDLIVAIGGDGTLQEVVTGQVRAEIKVPVAIIPVGTANVVAIALGLPWLAKPAVDNVVNGRVLPFDVGHLPELDRHFILMAAIGYPAKIIKDSPRRLKKIFGAFIYIWAGARNALRPGYMRISLTADGQHHQYVANTVLVSNIGKITDFMLRVTPDTSPHDGLFDVTIISSRTLWDVLKIIFRMLTWRWPLTDRMRHVQAREIIVDSRPAAEVQIDGESLGVTPLHAVIVPAAVQLIVGSRYK